jgi:hypothetical protein
VQQVPTWRQEGVTSIRRPRSNTQPQSYAVLQEDVAANCQDVPLMPLDAPVHTLDAASQLGGWQEGCAQSAPLPGTAEYGYRRPVMGPAKSTEMTLRCEPDGTMGQCSRHPHRRCSSHACACLSAAGTCATVHDCLFMCGNFTLCGGAVHHL